MIKYASNGIAETIKESDKKPRPKVKKKITTVSRNSPKPRVDWKKRDLELSWEVESACQSILTDQESKPIQISIALIGKRVGKLRWLEKHSDKLPVTMSFLAKYVESVSQFQMRRVRWAADQMVGEWPLKRWRIEKLAGLRPDYSQEVSDEINRCIGHNRYIHTFMSLEGITSWLH
nr:TnsD family Tn7-like transposition protein [Cohnella panacarvi]